MRDGAKERCRGQDPRRPVPTPLYRRLRPADRIRRSEKLKCRKQRHRSLPAALQIKRESVRINNRQRRKISQIKISSRIYLFVLPNVIFAQSAGKIVTRERI